MTMTERLQRQIGYSAITASSDCLLTKIKLGGIILNKKYYDAPEFELVRLTVFDNLLNASAEGDPNQIVERENDDNLG